MPRNLDLTSLRSFVAVADSGGVTKAAGYLHLTQSAVSMQLKRLEESLDVALIDRTNRKVALTGEGEQLLSYARRMLNLNDEVWGRLTANEFEGEIVLGVPHDIVYPYIPTILRRFAAEFPRMKIRMVSAPTKRLLEMFGRGECDAIVTTEDQPGPGGEVLVNLPLMWVGAVGGTAWKQEPLPVAFCKNCIFRASALRSLDEAGREWDMAVDSEFDNAGEAVVSADLGVQVSIKGVYPRGTAPILHNGELPNLGHSQIILYMQRCDDVMSRALGELIRSTYRSEAERDELVSLTG
jgi:DNA-binding transcriptional LysR family regulator